MDCRAHVLFCLFHRCSDLVLWKISNSRFFNQATSFSCLRLTSCPAQTRWLLWIFCCAIHSRELQSWFCQPLTMPIFFVWAWTRYSLAAELRAVSSFSIFIRVNCFDYRRSIDLVRTISQLVMDDEKWTFREHGNWNCRQSSKFSYKLKFFEFLNAPLSYAEQQYDICIWYGRWR